MYKLAWKIKERDWVQARPKHWKRVEGQLKELALYDLFDRRALRFHKAYFLKGELLPYDQEWVDSGFRVSSDIIGKPFDLFAMYKIWYHPVPDELLFSQWGEQEEAVGKLRVLAVVERIGMQLNLKCEFFEGRSYHVDRYLVPKSFKELSSLNPQANRMPEDIAVFILCAMARCVIAKPIGMMAGIYLTAF